MSIESIETLNLLSDSTFADKIDAQNDILTDIRDSLGGGLDTSSLVYGGTPDADSVVQLKKKDPVSGNDVNVYPALAPASSLGRYLLPDDTITWNSATSECWLCGVSAAPINNIIPYNQLVRGSKSFNILSTSFNYLWIKSTAIPGYDSTKNDEYNLACIMLSCMYNNVSSLATTIASYQIKSYNNVDYLVLQLNTNGIGSRWYTLIV